MYLIIDWTRPSSLWGKVKMFIRKYLRLAVPTILVLLSACGGGGNSNAPSSTLYSAVTRQVGDTWSQTVNTTTVGNTTTTTVNNFTVDAVNTDGSASVATSDSNNNFLGTSMLAADGNVLVATDCITNPERAKYSLPLFIGKTWASSYTDACDQTPRKTVTVNGNVLDEENITVAAGTFDTLKITTVALETSGNPTLDGVTMNSTCWWAIKIGVAVKCQSTIIYAASAPTTDPGAVDYELTSFTPGNSSHAPTPPSTIYPAPSTPAPPQLAGPANPVFMPNPKLVPVFFQDSQNQTTIPDFAHKLVASSEWGLVQEYGIGVASVLPPVTLATTGASVLGASPTVASVNTWLTNALTAQTLGTVGPTTLLLIFLPPNIPIKFPNGDIVCTTFGGYHTYATLTGNVTIPYAIIPDCQRGLDTITSAAAHEIFEAVTDPFLTGYNSVNDQIPNDLGWKVAYHDTENGDLCAARSDHSVIPVDIGYKIARIWSNSAAAGWHDPCLPISAITAQAPYFNSAPTLPATVQITNINAVTGSAAGVVIPVGTTQTIAVHLFSDKPTGGVWHVSAQQVGLSTNQTSNLTFSWDRTTGQNGDVLHLTIAAPSSLPNGAVFEIKSYYGGVITNWVGAVSN